MRFHSVDWTDQSGGNQSSVRPVCETRSLKVGEFSCCTIHRRREREAAKTHAGVVKTCESTISIGSEKHDLFGIGIY